MKPNIFYAINDIIRLMVFVCFIVLGLNSTIWKNTTLSIILIIIEVIIIIITHIIICRKHFKK